MVTAVCEPSFWASVDPSSVDGFGGDARVQHLGEAAAECGGLRRGQHVVAGVKSDTFGIIEAALGLSCI